ncbi:hypothetical protein JX266_003469 [Neoarthrinium moseri]|uniref:uncharacterized protein n=1 Tax=Neoarthrinium moseri TaxID=1658444 RepID=UPI001FDBDC0E|nr:uncharacterized protein JN550_000622 [Neoarthrinium moseri]KAI1851394.1 hypothetical protein JX266_003469 [Neoarthrinium moseri]KAI1878440.1 hypothetical protein JN550_000622 [Neoarthrinium moseri]
MANTLREEHAQEKEDVRSPISNIISSIAWFASDQWFMITLLLLILVASQVQVPSQQQATKETVIKYATVAVIFLINGCTISTQILVQTLKRWYIHIFVQALCFLLTSITTFAVVQATATNQNAIDAALLNGFVLMGCLPTALSFNTNMTKKANGNAALTLTESVLGSVMAPAISTVLMTTYSSGNFWYAEILPQGSTSYGALYKKVFQQLGLTLFLPLAVGQLLQYFLPEKTRQAMTTWKGSKLASFALLALIWSAYDGAFSADSFATLDTKNIVYLVFVNIGLFLIWIACALLLSVPWLSQEDCIAVAFCVPTKTPALGIPLVTIIFEGVSSTDAAKLYIPMIVYQCIQTCLASLATIPLKRWQARTARGSSSSNETIS